MPDKHPQFVLDILPSADLSEAAYVTGAANEAALKAITDWPNWSAPALALVGPQGAGKTHLASIWAARSGARMIPLELLAERHIEDGLPVPLCLEHDAGRGIRHEQALFHVLNLAKEEGQSVLITSQEPPARWPVRLPDVTSRLKAIPVAEIHAPDDALLEKVIAKGLKDAGIPVDPALTAYLLPRMERSFEQASAIARLIGERTLAEKRKATKALAAEILNELAGE